MSQTTPLVTPTPPSVATSDVVPGWLLYENDFYSYRFSYPPQATIGVQGVSGFPSEELPENMTAVEYRRQLEAAYPDDICVGVAYQSGFVIFTAPPEEGGKYAAPCGVSGVGDYDIIQISETVTIDGHPYTATGYEVRERNEEATWRGEFLSLRLGDGTSIQYGGGLDGSVAYEEYLATKEVLQQIVASYQSPATSLPVPTPTPTPIPGLVTTATAITVGDWSPDGRFLSYWSHTPNDLQANPQFPAGDFYFYDTVREQSCPLHGYRTGSASWERRHLWLANGHILVFGDEEVSSFSPCTHNLEVLTHLFPEPIVRVAANSTDRADFLLVGATGYWLYRPEEQEVRPVAGLAEGFGNGAAFSPDGRFVALSGDGGNSYLLDVNTAAAIQVATWQAPQGLGGLAAPDWLDNERVLVQASRDQGPLLVNSDGTVQNVGHALFDQLANPDYTALANRNEQSGHFVLLLSDTSFQDAQSPLQLYYSAANATQSLPVEQPLNRVSPSFSPDGRWLVLYKHGRSVGNSYNELWVRPLATVAQPSRLFVAEEDIHYRFAPGDMLVAFKVGNFIRVDTVPAVETVVRQGYGRYDVFPSAWAPDGRYLAVIGYSEDGSEQALFILPVEER